MTGELKDDHGCRNLFLPLWTNTLHNKLQIIGWARIINSLYHCCLFPSLYWMSLRKHKQEFSSWQVFFRSGNNIFFSCELTTCIYTKRADWLNDVTSRECASVYVHSTTAVATQSTWRGKKWLHLPWKPVWVVGKNCESHKWSWTLVLKILEPRYSYFPFGNCFMTTFVRSALVAMLLSYQFAFHFGRVKWLS